MHGSENESPVAFEMAHVMDAFGNTYEDSTDADEQCDRAGTLDSNVQNHANSNNNATDDNVNIGMGASHVMTEEELASNSFVLKLMERIAALEGRQTAVQEEVRPVTTQGGPVTVTDTEIKQGELQKHAEDVEVRFYHVPIVVVQYAVIVFHGGFELG